MNTGAGQAVSFFSGNGYQADRRVQAVMERATDDFYREQERQRQVEEYQRRQVYQEQVAEQIRKHEVGEVELAMRKEKEQAALLDK